MKKPQSLEYKSSLFICFNVKQVICNKRWFKTLLSPISDSDVIFLWFCSAKTPDSYLLFSNIYQFHRAAQLLDIRGGNFHHPPDVASLLRPRRHTLDGHPLCKFLFVDNKQKGVLRTQSFREKGIPKCAMFWHPRLACYL